MHSGVGVVDKNIKSAIVFVCDSFKKSLNFFLICGVADDWHTVSTAFFNLRLNDTLAEPHTDTEVGAKNNFGAVFLCAYLCCHPIFSSVS